MRITSCTAMLWAVANSSIKNSVFGGNEEKLISSFPTSLFSKTHVHKHVSYVKTLTKDFLLLYSVSLNIPYVLSSFSTRK